MKKVLFIDTNIFLRFYDSKSNEFKKLLSSIKEVKDNIFITKQIQNEVERNKITIFLNSFIEYRNQFSISKTLLPEHLESSADSKIREWNDATESIVDQTNKQKEKLKELTSNLINKISENKDEVSKSLHEIFLSSKPPTEAQLKKARIRKETGNPPGKNNDPLGDQISWEQLLSKSKTIEELWIISNDSDYLFEFDKKYYLNPFLNQELKAKNKNIKVNCFHTLSEGFKSYSKAKKIAALPEEQELNEITSEEKRSGQFPSGGIGFSALTTSPLSYHNLSQYSINNSLLPGVKCQICESQMFGPMTKASAYGGLSEQYFCKKCNKYYDTGEFID